ncbi:MAG: DUF2784 domain-containing protein [Thiotrichales bacterium]
MLYRGLADGVLVLHLGFILFAVLGGLLLLRWPRLVWLHVPAVIWGAWIEFSGGLCPLTPLENHFRHLAGAEGYDGGFIEHYLLPLIYPHDLTRELQWLFGGIVLVVNAAIYTYWLKRRLTSSRDKGG